MQGNEYSKYLLIFLFVCVIALSFLIIKDYITPILTGIILGYIAYPIYDKINKKIKNQAISAFTVSILLILILSIPVIILLNAFAKEALALYSETKDTFASETFDGKENVLEKIAGFFISDQEDRLNLMQQMQNWLLTFAAKTVGIATDFIVAIPGKLIDAFLIIFIMFYIFIDGKNILLFFENLLPIDKHHSEKLLKQFDDVTHALIIGTLLLAMIEGIIGGVGFKLSGISSPILWGFVFAFLALIPMIGPTIIYVPVALFMFYIGRFDSAVGVIITGVILTIFDTFIRPKLISTKSDLHPVFIFLGILGGVKLFGFIGIILGPVILGFITTFISIYEKEQELKRGYKS